MQVLVRDNNVDQALRVLKKKMQREGVFREMKLRRNYEKPSERRAREKAEAVRRYRKLLRKRMEREGYSAHRPGLCFARLLQPGPSSKSAGILLYRQRGAATEVFLVHAIRGGPFWKKKNAGAWYDPEGEPNAGEEPALPPRSANSPRDRHPLCRRFPRLPAIDIVSAGGKSWVHAFALEGGYSRSTLRR